MKKTCETCGHTHSSKEKDIFKFSEELKELGWKREKQVNGNLNILFNAKNAGE